MLLPIDRLTATPIMSLQTGMQLAITDKAIIDPRKLAIAAFRVRGNRLSHDESVLHPEDIREISDIGLIVDSDESLMPIDDLVRLHEIVDFKFELDGMRVENESGKLLGKVQSYAVDQNTFYIEQLYTKPPLLHSILTTGLTVHRNQIISINNQRLVVQDATVPAVEAPHTVSARDFINPFRAPATAPPES